MGPVCDFERVSLYRQRKNLQLELDRCPDRDGDKVASLHRSRLQAEIDRVSWQLETNYRGNGRH